MLRLKTPAALSTIIMVLAVAASIGGLMISDLYHDNEFITAGWFVNDLVTLVLAVPLLVLAVMLALRGSDRAQLVWVGMLDFMLYNYAFYLFGAAINRFFLLYVALFVLSMFALLLLVASLNVSSLSQKFRPQTPVRWVSGYLVFLGVMLGMAWIAQWVGIAFNGQPANPQLGEEGFKLVASLDLSLVVPFALLGAVLLWQRNAWGYVLAVMVTVKGFVYTVILIAGSLYAAARGTEGAADLVPLWVALSIGALLSCLFLLRNLEANAAPAADTSTAQLRKRTT